MNKNEIRRIGEASARGFFVGLLALMIAAIVCGSCTRKIYIPVEQTQHSADTLWRTLWRTDTIIDRDTLQTFVKGDSVMIERIRWRYRVKEKHDTIRQTHTDSIYVREPYPVEVVRETARPLSWWQKTLMTLGGISAAGILAALALLLYRRKT